MVWDKFHRCRALHARARQRGTRNAPDRPENPSFISGQRDRLVSKVAGTMSCHVVVVVVVLLSSLSGLPLSTCQPTPFLFGQVPGVMSSPSILKPLCHSTTSGTSCSEFVLECFPRTLELLILLPRAGNSPFPPCNVPDDPACIVRYGHRGVSVPVPSWQLAVSGLCSVIHVWELCALLRLQMKSTFVRLQTVGGSVPVPPQK